MNNTDAPTNISGYVTSEIISTNRVYKLTLHSLAGSNTDTRKLILLKLFMSFIKEDASDGLKELARSSKAMDIAEFGKNIVDYVSTLNNEYKYFGDGMSVIEFINLLSKRDGFLYVYVHSVRTVDNGQKIYKCYYYIDNKLVTYIDDEKFSLSGKIAFINIPEDVLDGLAIYFATPPPSDQTLSEAKKNESQGLVRPNDDTPQTDQKATVQKNPIINAFRNLRNRFSPNNGNNGNKGGKKSIKHNNIRGITSKLRRRSSVRRKKNTRRKHN
jgi:hypothetical protein